MQTFVPPYVRPIKYMDGIATYVGVKHTQSRQYPVAHMPQLEPLLSEYNELVRRLSCP
jgi:murein tripeptide amidase MpaA